MTSSRFLKGFAAALVVFMAGDILWHNVFLRDFYMTRFDVINGGPVEGSDIPVFIILFEIYASLVLTYVVLGMAKRRTLVEAKMHGAMMGLLVAAGINFICHSLIPAWDITMAMVDTLWGTGLGAIAGSMIWIVAGKKA
jgi:uncharacterized membrane protein